MMKMMHRRQEKIWAELRTMLSKLKLDQQDMAKK